MSEGFTERPKTLQGPFCWQNKAVLRQIADAYGDRSDKSLVLSLYLALTWIASDEAASTFKTSQWRIAERAGMSPRKVGQLLRDLAQLGVIAITRNTIPGTKELDHCSYTLGTACTTSGIPCTRFGTVAFHGSVPSQKKKDKKKGEKKSVKGAHTLPSLVLSDPDRSQIEADFNLTAAGLTAALKLYSATKTLYGEAQSLDTFAAWLKTSSPGKEMLAKHAKPMGAPPDPDAEPSGWQGALTGDEVEDYSRRQWIALPEGVRRRLIARIARGQAGPNGGAHPASPPPGKESICPARSA